MATIVYKREKIATPNNRPSGVLFAEVFLLFFFPLGFRADKNSYVRRNSFLDMCFLFLFWHCLVGPQKNHSLFRWQSKIPDFQTANIHYSFSFKTCYFYLFFCFYSRSCRCKLIGQRLGGFNSSMHW